MEEVIHRRCVATTFEAIADAHVDRLPFRARRLAERENLIRNRRKTRLEAYDRSGSSAQWRPDHLEVEGRLTRKRPVSDTQEDED